MKRQGIILMINADRYARPLCQGTEPFNLFGAHHLIGDQDILNACLNKRLRLRDLLAADSNRTHRNLAACNLGTFMTLGVRSNVDREACKRLTKPFAISLKCIKIQN